MQSQLAQDLRAVVEGSVADDPQTLEAYSRDASLFRVTPAIVVVPKSVHDIQQVVSYCSNHGGVSVTVRSGGTCMSGGPLSESIVIDISTHLNKISAIENHTVTTQPGAFYRDFEKKTLKQNLLLPSYPASRDICTIGGMVNNNSGGEKTLSYGKTNKYVKSMDVVLSDGNVYTFKKLTPQELEEKMELQTFEGEIYRNMHTLLKQHYDLIQNAKPLVSKNSAGYALWDIWDKHTFDLTQLFTGSQGTLGITTNVTFDLVTPRPHKRMLVILLKNIDILADVTQRILQYDPESFESYDDHTLRLATKLLPEMIKEKGLQSVFSIAWQFIPEAKMILTGGVPKLILLAEFAGKSEEEVTKRAQAAQTALQSIKVKTRITQSEEESQKYWDIRRESFNLLRHKVKDKQTAPFIDDLIVQPKQLPAFLPRLNEILNEYDLTYTIAGHVGDANFHIIPLMNLSDPKQRGIIPELSQRIYELVFEFQGSMTAEHNDGLIRSPFLDEMYGDEVMELFEQTKRIFDPDNIFNPGKKVGSSWKYAMQHLKRE